MNLITNIPLALRDAALAAEAVWRATPPEQRTSLRALDRAEAERAARSHALAVRRGMPRTQSRPV